MSSALMSHLNNSDSMKDRMREHAPHAVAIGALLFAILTYALKWSMGDAATYSVAVAGGALMWMLKFGHGLRV